MINNFYTKVHFMTGWHFGRYIQRLLDERGGKRRGWNQRRLAELSGLSEPYISWVIHGETSTRNNPPAMSVDALIALAKAFQIDPAYLLMAYQGKDPDQIEQSGLTPEQLKSQMIRLIDRVLDLKSEDST